MITGLVSFLKAQASLAGLVGNSIMPIPAPVDLSLYPLITYQMASFVPEYSFDGDAGVSMARIVFDCKAQSYGAARAIAELLASESILSGYSGVFPDGTRVYEIEIANVVDGFDAGSRVNCTSVHAMIQYES